VVKNELVWQWSSEWTATIHLLVHFSLFHYCVVIQDNILALNVCIK